MGAGKVITGVLEAGLRLDKALAEASGLSRERVKALIGEGCVALDGKVLTQPSAKAAEGARFRIQVPEAAPAEAPAQDIPLVIAYEDEGVCGGKLGETAQETEEIVEVSMDVTDGEGAAIHGESLAQTAARDKVCETGKPLVVYRGMDATREVRWHDNESLKLSRLGSPWTTSPVIGCQVTPLIAGDQLTCPPEALPATASACPNPLATASAFLQEI